jgi:hypothetical protein
MLLVLVAPEVASWAHLMGAEVGAVDLDPRADGPLHRPARVQPKPDAHPAARARVRCDTSR